MGVSADQISMIIKSWRSPAFEAITPKAYVVRLFRNGRYRLKPLPGKVPS